MLAPPDEVPMPPWTTQDFTFEGSTWAITCASRNSSAGGRFVYMWLIASRTPRSMKPGLWAFALTLAWIASSTISWCSERWKSPRGKAAGVTARFVLRFRTTGDVTKQVTVSGRLFLTRSAGGAWQIFGYDVAKGSK